tara:strand:- start:2228 stop:3181 length:954 start_codon:yes stop_codon:yes gene_type:complete
MADLWYWKLGFSSNPFNIKPAVLTNELAGIHVEPVLEKISNNEIQFIEAPLGMGKTSMLKNIISTFGGKKKLIYASCIKNECLEVTDLLKNSTLKGKLFGQVPEDMILMVDEAQNISKEDAKEITSYLEQGNIKSVVFFGIEYNKKLLTNHLNNSLNGNIISLPYLAPEEAIGVVRRRIGNLKLIPDYVIREIYGRSNGNPRRLLQNCEDICRKAVELSISELTITDVGTLLETTEPAAKKKSLKTKTKTVKKVKANKKNKTVKTAKKTKVPKKTEKEEKTKIKEKPVATVTYSGYNVENIRTYEEEMSTGKVKPEE